MRILSITLLLTISIICSCKKEPIKDTRSKDTLFTECMGFKPGSYWVYRVYQIDNEGNETMYPNVIDSCYVEKDTMINGISYVKFVEPSTNHYWRDSMDNIVSNEGEVVFSNNNFVDTFILKSYDSSVFMYRKMTDRDVVTHTPFGNFETKTMQTTYHYLPASQSNHKDKCWNVRFSAKSGIVVQTTLLADGYYIERRLLRYSIAN